MKKINSFFVYIFILCGILVQLIASSVVIVSEHERGVLLRFGQLFLNRDSEPLVLSPGMHFCIPGIDQVYRMDVRQQIWIMDSDPVQTVDQLYLLVDFYFKWEVSDFPEFFRIHAAGGARSWEDAKRNVELLLKQRVRNAVLEEFGRRPLGRLVLEDRKDMMNLFGSQFSSGLKDLAVTLIDLRLKKIELPEDVSEKVYNRMRTEREKSATVLRAKGSQQAEEVRAQTDYDVKMILAQAESASLKIRGQTDADIAEYYADAFAAQVPFYQFLRKIETIKQVFHSPQDVLILTSDDLFLTDSERDLKHD